MQAKHELAEYLEQKGDRFAGIDAIETAQEWLLYFDTVEEAMKWIDAGFWEPFIASTAHEAGLTPADAIAKLNTLPDEAFKGGYVQTENDRVYAACNNDVELPW